MIGAGPGQMVDERHEDSSYGFAAGLVIGMACGGILALLFAPKAGAELRGDIGTRTRTMRESAGRRYRDIADKATAGVEQMKEKAQGCGVSASLRALKAQGVAADVRDYAQSKTQQAANAVDQSTQH